MRTWRIAVQRGGPWLASLLVLLLAACGKAATTPPPAGPIIASTGTRVAFWLMGGLVIGGAIITITRRNAVSAVVALIATLFGLAGLYALLSAHFLAVIQVLVYAGAVMVLFIFVVLLLNREASDPWGRRGLLTRGLGVALALYTSAGLASFLLENRAAAPSVAPLGAEPWGGVARVGRVLFTQHIFAFEAVSLLLLVAVIGAVVLARRPADPGAHGKTDAEGGQP